MTPSPTILAAREELASYLNQNPVISSFDALTTYCQLQLAPSRVEVFHVLFLDRKNRLIADLPLSTGTVDHVPVYIREVIRSALLNDASAMILVHNHPSGDPSPSTDDIQIIKAAKIFNIVVHDHLIVAPTSHYSMKSKGDI